MQRNVEEINRELIDAEVHLILVESPRLERLVRYLREHLDERLTLTRAADLVGLEPTYFSKFFHETTGCTFLAWNRAVRMERARVLLRRRGQTVLSISFAVGYRDLTTFERAFKKCVGVSPRTYREFSLGHTRSQVPR